MACTKGTRPFSRRMARNPWRKRFDQSTRHGRYAASSDEVAMDHVYPAAGRVWLDSAWPGIDHDWRVRGDSPPHGRNDSGGLRETGAGHDVRYAGQSTDLRPRRWRCDA